MLLSKPSDYVFEMLVSNYGKAKKMWRRHIKEAWDYKCAYCGEHGDTIDHIHPQKHHASNVKEKINQSIIFQY